MRKVLIADPNTPFATVVGEALRSLGAYSVTLAASGPEAQKMCAELKPDLAVIDVDLPDCQPQTLIEQMREAVPGLPVVLIPYSKDEVPEGLEVQGILTKPFFLPDLPALINSILGAPPEPPPSPAAIPEQRKPATGSLLTQTKPLEPPKPAPALSKRAVINNDNRPLLEGHVEALSHALRGEPVLLTQGTKVITITPRLSQTASAALAEVVVKAWHASGGGSEVLRFEGDSESARYMLYSVTIGGDLVLSVALRVRIPLPTVRKLVRETAAELAAVAAE